jgi:hypothetical protein
MDFVGYVIWMDLGNITKVSKVSQEAQNGLSKKRKGKNSKFPKLSENGMMTKSASQAFQ